MTNKWECTACGADTDAPCSCGAPVLLKLERAVNAIKEDPNKSDREIASELGVGRTTVQDARKQVAGDRPPENTNNVVALERIGRDGKTYKINQTPKEEKPWYEKSALEIETFLGRALTDIYCGTKNSRDREAKRYLATRLRAYAQILLNGATNLEKDINKAV